jgi:L-lactate dehydrogenase complex protein LldG
VSQTGDREMVLARLRRGTAAAPPPNLAHPAPAPEPAAPAAGFRLLDGDEPLVDVFARTAADAGCTVHRDIDLADLVARHRVSTAVATAEAEVLPLVGALRELGVVVGDAADRDTATTADLGMTGCRAAVAATGSVVVGSDVPGARWASLLPRVHLCVVPAGAVVGTPGDVLRPLDTARLPAAIAFITGPSRTGDIEQLLTRGVHGPVAVEVVLVTGG